MDLFFIGTSHRTADVATRERLAALCANPREWLSDVVTSSTSIAEVLVLATCHRVEFYVVASDVRLAERALHERFVPSKPGIDGTDFAPSIPGFRVLEGEDALRHLCRVASGLDSLVVGEAEIAGQVRRAAVAAREAGTVGVFLERVIAGALRASSRVRSETRLSTGTVSTATAGVSLIEHSAGTLADKTVLVVGAGEVGRQAARRLQKRRAGRILVSSRSEKHATELAQKTGASVVPLIEIPGVLSTVDAILAAVQSPAPVVTKAMLIGRDPSRPLVVVDLSMPRVIDPEAATIPGITLKSVDDLGDIVNASLARRISEIPRAEVVAHDEAARAYAHFRLRLVHKTA